MTQIAEQSMGKKANRWLILLVSFAFGLIISGAAGGAAALHAYGTSVTPVVTAQPEPASQPEPSEPADAGPGAVAIAARVLPPPPPPAEAIAPFSTPYATSTPHDTQLRELFGAGQFSSAVRE